MEETEMSSQRLLDNLGIRINLVELPEYQAWKDGYGERSRLAKWFLRTFCWTRTQQLKWDLQVAFIRRVLEELEDL
jgi:hypothetical protein